MSDVKRPDETIPGGKYLNATEDRYVDANGRDLGPVEDEDADEPLSDVERAADDGEGHGELIDPSAEVAAENENEVTVEADPDPDPEKPAKRTRAPKADD